MVRLHPVSSPFADMVRTASPVVERAPVRWQEPPPDSVSHWYCCDPYRALCGAKLDGEEADPGDPDPDCVVCNDLYPNSKCSPGCDY